MSLGSTLLVTMRSIVKIVGAIQLFQTIVLLGTYDKGTLDVSWGHLFWGTVFHVTMALSACIHLFANPRERGSEGTPVQNE
jgi:hypothetical protein